MFMNANIDIIFVICKYFFAMYLLFRADMKSAPTGK